VDYIIDGGDDANRWIRLRQNVKPHEAELCRGDDFCASYRSLEKPKGF